jgi:hypothetical protein
MFPYVSSVNLAFSPRASHEFTTSGSGEGARFGLRPAAAVGTIRRPERKMMIWLWVNTYRYTFSGMNIHLPAILGFTRYQGFDPSPFFPPKMRELWDTIKMVM